MTHRYVPLRLALILFALVTSRTVPLEAQSAAGAVVLSERVGSTLDSLEIVYFGLFPRQGVVRSASIGRDGSGLLRLALDRVDREDTVVTLDEGTERRLVSYIEDFERMETGEVAYLYDANAPYRLHSRLSGNGTVRVETVDGLVVSGALLHADDRGVVILPGGRNYEWRRVSNEAVAIAGASIERVVISGPVSTAVVTGVAATGVVAAFLYVQADDRPTVLPLSMAIVLGGLFGGSATSLYTADQTIEGDPARYLALREAIASESVFSRIEPPEVRYFADDALSRSVRAIPPTLPDRSFSTMAVNRFSVAVNATTAATEAGSNYVVRDLLNATVETVKASFEGPGFGADVTYDLTSWLEIGAGVSYREAGPASSRVQESIEELGGLVLAHVNLMPRRALGRSELELLVGVGIGYSRLTEGFVFRGNDGVTLGASIVRGSPTGQLRAQARFNLFGNLGLQIVGYGQWYSSLKVPQLESEFPTTRERLGIVEAHEITLSGLHLQIGIRYWF